MGEREIKVLEYMRAHGGVITRPEALAIGMSPATLDRRVRAGYLVRVGHGVYAQPGVLESERSLLRAATEALAAVASHESAARLQGMDTGRYDNVSVSVPVRRSNRFYGVVVHQLTDLTSDETIAIRGIPTTDSARTILDLAAVMPGSHLAGLLDQSVKMGLNSYEHLSERLEATARRGKPGVVKLRRILKVRLGRPTTIDSTLESRLIELLVGGGLPTPTAQFQPDWLRKVNGRVDLAYREEKIIVEGDSQRWHGSPEAFQTDRRRDNLAQLAGWVILRFTWEDITKRPSYVVHTVEQALIKRCRPHI